MKTIIVCSLAVLFSSSVIADENDCVHLKYGVPFHSDFVDCRIGYAVGYSFKRKSPDWVAYRLLKQEEGTGYERSSEPFQEDKEIPEQYRTTLADYAGSGYHRGHLANSESIDESKEANEETFILSNIVPQNSTHNKGIWKGLENRERKYANQSGEVYVVTGPAYGSSPDMIGVNNDVPVPDVFWKVIYQESGQRAISFVIEHEPLTTSLLNQKIESVDYTESLLGIDLLSELPDELEDQIESVKFSKQW